ncbi:MAG: D-alanyl-D-alanine carboxypeptidase/D-alanyl-D-alanine-endopeptidase [Gemmatimonadota bacterium]
MRNRFSTLSIAALAVSAAWTGSLAAQTEAVEPARGRALASPEAIGRLIDPIVGRARGGEVGVAVFSVDRQIPLYLNDADDPLLPASNMKLYTTASALDRLGPDFQYTTSLYADGTVLPNGTLTGDLILVGRGDPAISGRFYGDSTTYVFDRMAQGLREKGIRRVTGRLIGDTSYFDDRLVGPGWESGNLLWWYGARASALAFNDNVVTVEVRPGSYAGAPAEVLFHPHTDDLVVDNRVVTAGRRGGRSVGIRRRPEIGGYEIWGRVALGGPPVRHVVAVDNPPAFVLSVLRDRLERAGIQVAGEDQVVWQRGQLTRRRWTLLVSHTSPRMIDLVRVVNKSSQNFFAEQILKTLGAVFHSEGSFQGGAKVVHATLQGLGVSSRSLVVTDGSGLSRWNLVTARTTAELLVAMRYHPYFGEYYASLLIAGYDGDPRRLDAPEALGNVHSKTGTLRGVSALSGYVTTSDGELVAFSVISNGLGKGSAIAVEDAVAERLARFSSWSVPLLESSVTGR